ncbi:MAG: hypothetical protein K2J18_06655, partial [Paramuribaculum sp.]|nr:hypothetical protein [Paramuribaculum sp.]
MSLETNDNNTRKNGIIFLWITWVVSTGCLLAVELSPLVVARKWILIPFIAVVLDILLYIWISKSRERSINPCCYLIPFITSRVLLWSALAMIAIILLQPSSATDHEIAAPPVIPILVITPITVIFTLWRRLAKLKFPFCRDCRLRYGGPVERGFLGAIFSQEGAFQNKVLLLISTFIGGVDWVYYSFRYINENLNGADRYFFFVVPGLFFVFSAIYMGIRYFGLWHYYEQDLIGSEIRRGPVTSIRYLLVWDNKVFVRFTDPAADDMFNPFVSKGDTPASVIIGRQRHIDHATALSYLKSVIPMLTDTEMKFLYSTESVGQVSNTYHFIVFVNDHDHTLLEQRYSNGSWLSMLTLQQLIEEKQIEPALAAELYRIYTVTMASKTYN